MLDELEASVKDDVTTRDFLGSFYYSSTELCQTLTNWKSAVKGRIPKDVAALEVMKRKNVLDVVTRREAEPETSSDKDAK